MKNFLIYSLALTFSCLSLNSCQEINHPEEKSLNEIEWLDKYQNFLFDGNYIVQLVRDGSLDLDELLMIRDHLENDPNLDIEVLISGYIGDEEIRKLNQYLDDFQDHLMMSDLDQRLINKMQNINEAKFSSWRVDLEVAKGNVAECEREAALAGLNTLGGSIAAGAGTAIFTGGISVVMAVIGGSAAAVANYYITYYVCIKRPEK